MLVYCAGKTQDIPTVRLVQAVVTKTGHQVTHDWTRIVEENKGDVNEVDIPQEKRQQYAIWDMEGVVNAQLVIACGHPDLCGTLWECGAASVLGKPLWLVFWEKVSRHSVFEDLPNVATVRFPELERKLETARRIELQAKLMQGVDGQAISRLKRQPGGSS